jgi:hypothetical protein
MVEVWHGGDFCGIRCRAKLKRARTDTDFSSALCVALVPRGLDSAILTSQTAAYNKRDDNNWRALPAEMFGGKGRKSRKESHDK